MSTKNIKPALFYVIFIFLSNAVSAQFFIHGKVIDSHTGEALPYAVITCNNTKSLSDLNGHFSCKTTERKVRITAEYLGYRKVTIDTMIQGQQLDMLVIKMLPDDNTLQEVTITSSKYKKNVSDVTVSMEILNPRFVENNNTLKFDELLEKIPGVNYIDGQVNIRGGAGFSYGAGSRVMVLLDNIPALQFDSGYPNWENIPVERAAHIEVLKGANSTLYGSGALNGVINILSEYATKEGKLKVKTFYGFYDSPADPAKKWWDKSPSKYGLSALVAKKIRKLDVLASLYFQNANSYKQYCFNNYRRGTLKLDYHISDKLKTGIDIIYNSGEKISFFFWKNSKEGAYQADSTSYAGQDKKIILVDPYIQYQNDNNTKHSLRGRIYYASNFVSGSKSNKSISYYSRYQFQKNLIQWDMVFTGGIEGTISDTKAELYGDTSYIATNYGLFAQVDKKIFDRLNFVAGARYELNKITGPKIVRGVDISSKYTSESKPVFRLGLNYKLFRYSNIRFSWGQGFRYPTIAEKFTNTYAGNIFIYPNPDLQPESGYTVEAGLRQGWKWGGIKGYVDISLFQSEYRDMIEYALKYDSRRKLFYFTAVNIGNTIIKGTEITTGFTGKIGETSVGFTGGVMFIDPKYKDFTEEVKRNLSVDYNILKYRYKNSYKYDIELNRSNIILGFGATYNSFMEAVDKVFVELDQFIKGVKEYREEHNTGNTIYRMRMGYNFKNIKLLFNINNLFNREYSIRPGLLEAPRNFLISLNYTTHLQKNR